MELKPTGWWSRVPRLAKLYLLAAALVAYGARVVLLPATAAGGTDRLPTDLGGINPVGAAMVVFGLLMFFRLERVRAWTDGLMGILSLLSVVLGVWALTQLRLDDVAVYVLCLMACSSASDFLGHPETRELFRRKTEEMDAEA
jgi:hypothetical protein